jgi:hypothetical protein
MQGLAATLASDAARQTMEAYRDGTASEEPAITGALVLSLRAGPLTFSPKTIATGMFSVCAPLLKSHENQ